MKKYKKLSVTIGVPAFNEENNIGNLLNSIISQKKSSFIFNQIYVVCDGCDDDTVSIVKKFINKYSYIHLIENKVRQGKMKQLNMLYKISTSDIFISLDADIILGNNTMLEELVKQFYYKNVGLVGAYCIPAKPSEFFEHIVVGGINIWNKTRVLINHGDSVHNHHAQASAVSKTIYKNVYIPSDICAEDDFLYFYVKKMNMRFRFAQKAISIYRAPSDIKDFFMQTTRFITAKEQVVKYHGDWIRKYYHVPLKYKVIGLFTSLRSDPFYVSIGVFFQILTRLLKDIFKDESKEFWTRVSSSKRIYKIHI